MRSACCVILLLLLAACTASGPTPVVTVESATPTPAAFPTTRPTATPTPTPTITPTPTPILRQLTTGGCCVMPSWSPDSKQVLFIDKPASQAEAGVYAVDIDRPQEPELSGPVGIYSPDRSLVAYPADVRTVVEKLSTGDRWVIPNNGQALEFSADSRRVAWEIEAISGPYDERQNEAFQVVFAGKMAIDDNASAVPGTVAVLLDVPCQPGAGLRAGWRRQVGARAAARGRGGEEVVECTLPALFTCEKGLNEPRYASLTGIMKAKKKPIEEKTAADLGLAADRVGKAAAGAQLVKLLPLPERGACKFIDGDSQQQARTLVQLLRNEAKII